MATGGSGPNLFSSADQEVEYLEHLYKNVLPHFKTKILAEDFIDCPQINGKLSLSEMERIKARCNNAGNSAGSELLLDFLKMKHGWFDAMIKAMRSDNLKLAEHIPKFLEVKAEVDKKWQRTTVTASAVVCNPSIPSAHLPPPTQVSMQIDRTTTTSCMTAPVWRRATPGPAAAGGVISSDFNLQIQTDSIDRDVALEQEGEKPEGSLEAAAVPSPGQEQPAEETKEPMDMSTEDIQYRDAASASTTTTEIYCKLTQIDQEENMYTRLNYLCLEMDASPIPMQPSDALEPEVGEAAAPEVLTPQEAQQRRRQVPQTRQDHPSLRQAISNNPNRDFCGRFVNQELSSCRGWSNLQEEHKVIQLIRPHRHNTGFYVIWFWDLAMRPTICVAHEGKVITFVVHKSVSRPTKYFINRRQKRCSSLRQLVDYHISNGIQYSRREGETITVWLNHPHGRE
ncbi:uncharacterized protein LOC143299868 isoform X2 [Babylonia areolata]|uniref:uncharacterized protein LOC143299868 isoform X2 n=1 Tax=Babylonia areolata TaxID=304850 RepID=UPI003FD10F4B